MSELPVKRRGVTNLKRRTLVRSASDALMLVSTEFPANDGLPTPIVQILRPDSSIPTATRILVVDDDDQVCELLSHVLIRSHYHVDCASSGEQALTILCQRQFDMVVCDMHLGGMTGLDLAGIAFSLYPHIPFVLMTARRDPDLMRTALRRGIVDFLPKPFEFENIPIIIERNLERRALNEQQAESHRHSQIFSNVQVLAAAIDAKEPYTAQHSRRVARLAVAAAEAMGLTAAELPHVEWAAQVHDVGKIATPDHILLKAGPLSEEEWSVIRRHPVKGAEIVAGIQHLAGVAAVVRSHHERIDGKGYPDGLSGDQIPIQSRIIAVADAFEVMTSNRVYRARVSIAEAVRQLRAGANTQFDTTVVSAFVALSANLLD